MADAGAMPDLAKRLMGDIAVGDEPDLIVINPKDLFVLRGTFGINPWRLSLDMRRCGSPMNERRSIMRDWRRAYPWLARLSTRDR